MGERRHHCVRRDLPRVPLYPDFWQWADWGRELMDLHVGYDQAEPFPLERTDIPPKEGETVTPKPLLKADKEGGRILVDTATTLSGIPSEAWAYQLGTRCAIDWVLDQHKEKKPKDPTVRELFNTYRFADHKEAVIDLLRRVTTVSVRTQAIVANMAGAER